jgi:predicted O-linked N-acetylglucosamine transferase (SPINDLY family)
MRTSNFQIILPFDGCSRHEDIFDYLITEEYLTNEKTMSLYKEKLILLENSSLFCVNPYLDLFKKNLDEAENPFENYKKQGYKILGNFSDCYKIDIEIFSVWCQILSKIENTILVLKFCNEESSKNLKSFASDQGIDPDRLIFYIIDSASKYSSAPYIKYIDVYLDIQTLTGDYEVFFCLFSGVPIVVMSNEVYGQSSKLSTSIVCSGKEGSKIANGKEEYIHQAIKFLTIKPKRLYNDWSPLNIFLDTFYHVLKDFRNGKM